MTKALLMIAALLIATTATGSPRIAIEDAKGNSCIEVGLGGELATFEILAYHGEFPDGHNGFEFRITGIPQDWVASVTPNPTATLVLGDPLGAGTNIGFPVCNPGENGRVSLFTVEILPTFPTTVTLQVEAHANPSNPNFNCPNMANCIGFGAYCFPPGTIGFVRSDGGSCEVSVEGKTWTAVKSEFRQ
jgi:hypothetical protein